jgi:hypothetical protein
MDWDAIAVSAIAILGAVVLLLLFRRRPGKSSKGMPEVRQCPKCGGFLPKHKSKCNYDQHGWD